MYWNVSYVLSCSFKPLLYEIETRAERAVHLEAIVEQLRQLQAELGVEMEFTYLKRKESVDSDTEIAAFHESLTHNVSLDHTGDFSLQHLSEVEECLKKAQAEKHKREQEVADLESDLTELLAELGCDESVGLQTHKYATLHQYYKLKLTSTIRLQRYSIDQLRERVASLFQLRAKRQEEISILAEKITLLWDKLGVDSAVREAWVLQNNGKITDGVVRACGILFIFYFVYYFYYVSFTFAAINFVQSTNWINYKQHTLHISNEKWMKLR
jgi:hypothetical protein